MAVVVTQAAARESEHVFQAAAFPIGYRWHHRFLRWPLHIYEITSTTTYDCSILLLLLLLPRGKFSEQE